MKGKFTYDEGRLYFTNLELPSQQAVIEVTGRDSFGQVFPEAFGNCLFALAQVYKANMDKLYHAGKTQMQPRRPQGCLEIQLAMEKISADKKS
jgi:hypothetical protein